MSNLNTSGLGAILARVQQQFGWSHWQEDPWQSTANFFSWLEEAPDNLLTVIAVNETKGKYYLARLIRSQLGSEDFSGSAPEDLAELAGIGGLAELEVAHQGSTFDYPATGLPSGFLNAFAEHFKDRPFAPYIECIRAVFRGRRALKAMKLETHPELVGLIHHTITNSPRSDQLADMWSALHPDVSLPTAGDGWEMMGLEKPLSGLGLKYKDLFDNDQEEAEQEATSKALDIIATEMEKRPEKLMNIGAKGGLLKYLAKAAQNKMNTSAKRLSMVKKQADRDRSGMGVEGPYDDRYWVDEDVTWSEPSLRELDLDWDSLTPREITLLQDIRQALELGYDLDSKKGKSMRQYWPEEDYSRNMKAFERLRHKLKGDPSSK
jgi:hypothetical protein